MASTNHACHPAAQAKGPKGLPSSDRRFTILMQPALCGALFSGNP